MMSVRVQGQGAPVDGLQGMRSPLEIRRAEQPQTTPQQPVKATPAAEVSAIAAKLVAVERQLVNEPYDRQRIEDIKQQIRSGAYKMNPDNIAERIVDSATSYSRNER